jgi:hypothetical protein
MELFGLLPFLLYSLEGVTLPETMPCFLQKNGDVMVSAKKFSLFSHLTQHLIKI